MAKNVEFGSSANGGGAFSAHSESYPPQRVPVTDTGAADEKRPPLRVAVTQHDRDEVQRNFDIGNFSPRRALRELGATVRPGLVTAGKEAEEMFRGTTRNPYLYYDSPLLLPTGKIETPINPYSFDFDNFVGEEQTFKEYLQEGLPPDAVGVDIGGPGSAVFGDFDEGTYRSTYGMTLVDLRSEEQKAIDAARGHEVIPGDFQNNWEELDHYLAGRTVHTWFVRMGGGEDFLPQNPYEQHAQFNKAYHRTHEGAGKLYIAVPKLMLPLAAPWVEKVKVTCGETLRVMSSGGMSDDVRILEVAKHQGAPEDLPALSIREVNAAYRALYERR